MSKKFNQEYSEIGASVNYSSSIKHAANQIIAEINEISMDTEYASSNPIERVSKFLTGVFEKDSQKYFGLMRALASTPAVTALATNQEIISAITKLGVSTPTLVTPPLIHIVSEKLMDTPGKVITPFHQDVTSTLGSVGQLVVWIPLHDVTRDNYPVSAVLGSHKLGMLETKETEFGLGVANDKEFEDKDEAIELLCGEFLLFSSYLVHRTLSKGDFRMAVSFRYNDLSDENWQQRNYFNPFQRHYDRSMYESNKLELESNAHYFGSSAI